VLEVYNEIAQFFQVGGVFLYPIAAVLAVGLAISLERYLYLTAEKIRNASTFEKFLPLLRTNDMEKMQLFTRDHTAPVSRIIGCGLDMMKVSRLRADIENAMGEGVLEAMPRLEVRTGYLAVLANIATLLGLLGTIVGLIMAFNAVADADPAEKSRLLSQSISVAMYTTAFGLVAAIPLLVIHALLQNKTVAIVRGIEMSAAKFLNVMTLNREIEVGIAAPAVTGYTPPAPTQTPATAAPAHTTADSEEGSSADTDQAENQPNGGSGDVVSGDGTESNKESGSS